MTDRVARLILDGNPEAVELPIFKSNLGPDVIDVRGVIQSGYLTYDPGFMSTASCDSDITYIDGDAGVLLYRGYPIEQLAEHSDFLETCYLLLHGELPDERQKREYEINICYHTMVDQSIHQFFNGFPRTSHPMSMLVSVVGALSAFYHDTLDISDPDHRMLVASRIIAKMPTLAAMCYKHGVGQPFMYPQNSLSFSENFLHMMFGTPCEDKPISPVLARAIDLIFLLHADHEQNASTSTVRLAGSTGANPFSCAAAGVAALWGPAHGGANEAVLQMLTEIGSESRIDQFIRRAKDPDDSYRLMGFGHRVYKNFDPRAKVMRKVCHEVLDEVGEAADNTLFKIARRLERIALEDDYFIERKLYPNVDFYSGIILKALGIPTSMFTVIFATGRTPGWMANWNEMVGGNYRIGRPRQLYLGPEKRDYPVRRAAAEAV